MDGIKNSRLSNRRLWVRCVLLAGLVLGAGQASADLTSASVSPMQRQLTALNNNSIAVSWRVTTDASGRVGVSSSPAALIDANSGASLGTIGMQFSAQTPGPYTFNEALTISAAQVTSWQNAGISQVLVQRDFSDFVSGPSVSASLNLLVPPRANFTAARVSPSQRQVFASQNNTLSLNWQLATAGQGNGVVSAPARILDPRSGTALATLGDALSDTGSGPYVFSEMLELDAARVQGILARGLNRVVLERTFSDPIGGGSTKTHMILVLNNSQLGATRDSAPGELSIKGLSLEFDTGNNLALSDLNQSLQAKLTLSYTGSGLLEGRWLVAEPGSTEGTPLYRTLALVRRNLLGNQRVVLESPMLPTVRTGKYLVRFCVNRRELMPADELIDPQCPLQEQLIDAAYQVQGSLQTREVTITGLSPNQQSVGSKTPFEWLPVAGAEVYQMQLFALQAPGTSPPSSRGASEMMEPRFITGMLLPAGTTYTPLSELVRSKLEANKQYLWRITAHDQSGRLIGSSGEYKFMYRPEEQP